MRKVTVLFFVWFLFTTTVGSSVETSIRIAGNGGHPLGLEFLNLALSIGELLKSHPQAPLPNGISANQFLNDIQNANPSLEIRVVPESHVGVDFARNYPDENLVHLNEQRWQNEFENPIEKLSLLFHELLEVLYNEDKDYQFSHAFKAYLTQNPEQVVHILQSQSIVDLDVYLKSYSRLTHLLFSQPPLEQYAQSQYLDGLIKLLKQSETNPKLKSNWLFWLRPSSLKKFKQPWSYEQHLSAEMQLNKHSSSIIHLSWMASQDSLLNMILGLLSTSINEIKIKSELNPDAQELLENLNSINENKGELITAFDEFQKKNRIGSKIKVIKEEKCYHKRLTRLIFIDLETNEVLTVEPSRQINSKCEEQKIVESLENNALENFALFFENLKLSGYNYEIVPALRYKLNAETALQTSIFETVKSYASVNLGTMKGEEIIEITEQDLESNHVAQDMAKLYNSYTCNQNVLPISSDLVEAIHSNLKDFKHTYKNIAFYALQSDKGIRSLILFNKQNYEEILIIGELFYVGPNMCDNHEQLSVETLNEDIVPIVYDSQEQSSLTSVEELLKKIEPMYCGSNKLFDSNQNKGITEVCVGKIETHMMSFPVFILKHSDDSLEIFNVLSIKDTTEPFVKNYEVYDYETIPLYTKTFVLVFDPNKPYSLKSISGKGKNYSFDAELVISRKKLDR